jgi:hypothetical protein
LISNSDTAASQMIPFGSANAETLALTAGEFNRPAFAGIGRQPDDVGRFGDTLLDVGRIFLPIETLIG